MVNDKLNVLLLSRNDCLATAIGRPLGDGFLTQVCTELEFNKLNGSREWCDVLLLDLLAASTGGDYEPGLRLMDEDGKAPLSPAHRCAVR